MPFKFGNICRISSLQVTFLPASAVHGSCLQQFTGSDWFDPVLPSCVEVAVTPSVQRIK